MNPEQELDKIFEIVKRVDAYVDMLIMTNHDLRENKKEAEDALEECAAALDLLDSLFTLPKSAKHALARAQAILTKMENEDE